jgi:hypothetical protein
MASRCTICSSEHLVAIDDLADSQSLTLKEIAHQFQVSYPALVRHCARHGKNAPPPAAATENGNGDSLAQEAEKWRLRADQVWAQSVADQDTRGQVQALQAGLRSVELQHKQEQRAAEPVPVPAGETVLTIEAMDKLVQHVLDEDPKWPLIETIRQLSLEELQAIADVAKQGGHLIPKFDYEATEQKAVNP